MSDPAPVTPGNRSRSEQHAMKRNHTPFVATFFSLAVILRALLCWANPPENSFDDHFEPIFMIMNTGVIPPKDACFQCYHPPVFYWISAMIGDMALRAGVTMPHMVKLLQFVSCCYGILTVGICYLILQKLPLSDFSRWVSFGTVCLFPRHIYMSAMNSNDTLSYLCVAVSIYIAILALERRFSPLSLGVLSVVLAVTIFTKYTAFVVMPMVLTLFWSAFRSRLVVSGKKLVISILGTFLLPLSILAVYMFSNWRHYHSPLPWNIAMDDPSAYRPRDKEGINFVTFKPWEDIRTPMLAPGKLHSFWTLVYSGMWFDTEPYFLPFLDSNTGWWKRYHGWYRGEGSYPGENPSMSGLTRLAGSGLILLGLFPLALVLAGFYCCVSRKSSVLVKATPAERINISMFPVLVAFNAAGVIAVTLRLPVYNSMKPSYFLNSMPAFMIFLGVGLMMCEKSETLKRIVLITFSALFALVILHVLHIVLAGPK